jgi:sialic acid synthase SpsE
MVGGKAVGPGEPVFVVAEIGNNHNGDLNLAKKLIAEAAKLGANAVKFQKRFIEETFVKEMREKKQTKTLAFGRTYGEYRQRLEFDLAQFRELKDFADKLGVFFFVTPFDFKSVEFLEELGVAAYKISSFDVTNWPLLELVAKKNKPIFLSTGMCTLEELDEAVKTILKYNNKLIINHCVSTYPTPPEEINLKNIETLIKRYQPLPVGYSGHETGILPTLLACAMGACTVERHLTLDKGLPGPDHATVSIDLNELKDLVSYLRGLEIMLGDRQKIVRQGEVATREKHSKSIVAKVFIPAGTTIGIEMLTFKSPGSGLKPSQLNALLGKMAKINIEEDTVIPQEALNW